MSVDPTTPDNRYQWQEREAHLNTHLSDSQRSYERLHGTLRRPRSTSRSSRTVTPRADTGGVALTTASCTPRQRSPVAAWRERRELEYLAEAQEIGRKVAQLALPSTAAKALDLFRPPRSALSGLTGWDIQLHGDNVRVDSHDPNLAYKPSTVHWRDTNVTIIGNGPVHAFSSCWYYEVTVKRVDALPATQAKVVLPEDPPAGLTLGVTATNPDNLASVPGGGSWTLPGTVLVGYDGQVSVTESSKPQFAAISTGWSPARALAAGRRVGVLIPAHGGVRHRLFLLVDGRVVVRGPKVPFDPTNMPVWPVVELLGNARAVTLVQVSALSPPTHQLAACIGDENDKSVEEEIEEARVCCQWGVAGRSIRVLADRKMAVVALDDRGDEKLPLGGRVVVGNGPVKEFTDGVKYFEIKIKMLRREVIEPASAAGQGTSPFGKRRCLLRQKTGRSMSVGYHMSPQGIHRIPQVCHIRDLPNTNYIEVEHPAVPLGLSTRIGLLLSREEKILALFVDGQLHARMNITCAALLDATNPKVYPVVDLGKGIWAVSFVASAGPPKEAQPSIELSNRNNAAVMIQRFVRRRRNLQRLKDAIIEAQGRRKRLEESAQQKSMKREQMESLQEIRNLMRSTKDILSNIQLQQQQNQRSPSPPPGMPRKVVEDGQPLPRTTGDEGDVVGAIRRTRPPQDHENDEPSQPPTRANRRNTEAATQRTVAVEPRQSGRVGLYDLGPEPADVVHNEKSRPRKLTPTGAFDVLVVPGTGRDPLRVVAEEQVDLQKPRRSDDSNPPARVSRVSVVETIPNIRSGCRSFLYPSPWRFLLVSKDGVRLSRRKGAESSAGNIAIGAQPLRRHDKYLSFFYSAIVETFLPGLADGLAVGVTASTPDEIKDDIAKSKPLAKSADRVLDTFMVGLRGKMYSPFWERKSRPCPWSGTLENGLQGGSMVTLAVGLNGRMHIFVDGELVDIKCPSGVPQRDSAPVYPIVELAGQAHVKLVPDAELPRSIALAVDQLSGEAVSDEDGSGGSESSYTTSSASSEESPRSLTRSSSYSSRSSSYDSESRTSRSSSGSSNSQTEASSSEESSGSSAPGYFDRLFD
ncbi:hypothetical protein FOL46_007326 [Perkinsus olseni]|uniref:NHR domain-containing protein n=1 Tax=Perkinsus olseni TaxID=32597 RepID=A0A7J6MR17_PEROL|nr:hypothetical protein FOL46_007326 [Perkinsus olseni]